MCIFFSRKINNMLFNLLIYESLIPKLKQRTFIFYLAMMLKFKNKSNFYLNSSVNPKSQSCLKINPPIKKTLNSIKKLLLKIS